MVERGDSAATVCEVIDLLTHENKKEYRVTSVKNENSHQAIKEENPVE